MKEVKEIGIHNNVIEPNQGGPRRFTRRQFWGEAIPALGLGAAVGAVVVDSIIKFFKEKKGGSEKCTGTLSLLSYNFAQKEVREND